MQIGPVANPVVVKALMDHLLRAYEDFLNNAPKEVEYLDAFMGVHNFHVVAVLDIEKRTAKANPERQLFLRRMAVDTFRQAMENKPAFRPEEE